jgi:hypothetical protein
MKRKHRKSDCSSEEFCSGKSFYTVATGVQLLDPDDIVVVQVINPGSAHKAVCFEKIFINNLEPITVDLFHEVVFPELGTALLPQPLKIDNSDPSQTQVRMLTSKSNPLAGEKILKSFTKPPSTNIDIIEDDLVFLLNTNADQYFYIRLANNQPRRNAVSLEITWLEIKD